MAEGAGGVAADQLITELVRFARLSSRMKAMFSIDELGAEHSALLLLFPLLHEGPLRIRDLAEMKRADPSTVSRQAAQLVRAGLVRREADPADGRASRLALTPVGEAACERLRAVRRKAVSTALSDWPDERIAAFTELFHQFNTSVEAHQRTSAPATSDTATGPAAGTATGPAAAEPIQESA